MTSAEPLPLDGILVADFSRVLAGPYASMLMGDLGATVVKVERPGAGDESRAWGPPFVDRDSTYYLSVNRNKHGIALDLRDPGDLARAVRLASAADVLIENFRPGTIERFGLGYDELATRNPGLVFCSISGFGRDGGAHLAGYDFLIQAVGGLMSITGPAEGEPTKVGVALVDVITGLFATIGAMAALQERVRSGRGQRVDVNLLSSILSALVNQGTGFLATGRTPARMGNEHPSVAPYELYRTGTGSIVITAGNERQFAALTDELGDHALAQDARFSTNASRVMHRNELRNRLEAALATGTAGDWVRRLQARGVPCGVVNDLAGAFRLAQQLGLSPSVELDDGERAIKTLSNPLGLSRTPPTYRLAPPRLGEHTDLLDELIAGRERRADKVDDLARTLKDRECHS